MFLFMFCICFYYVFNLYFIFTDSISIKIENYGTYPYAYYKTNVENTLCMIFYKEALNQ